MLHVVTSNYTNFVLPIILYHLSLISEKTLDELRLTKLPCEEGKVVFNNEPGPEKYVSK